MSVVITSDFGKRVLGDKGFQVNDFIDVDRSKVFRTFHRMGKDIKNTIKKSFSVDDTRISADDATYADFKTRNVRFNYPKRRAFPRRRRDFLWRSIKVDVSNDRKMGESYDPLDNVISVYSRNKYSKTLDEGIFRTAVYMPLQPKNYYKHPSGGLEQIGRFLVTRIGKDLYRPEYLFLKTQFIRPFNFFSKGLTKYKKSALFESRINELLTSMGL